MISNLKKNFIFNLIYQILTLILPLVTAPYISRTLGSDAVGRFSYTYSVAMYFSMFITLGLNNYGNRTIAANTGNKKNISKNFFEIYIMQLTMGLVVIACYIFYAAFIVKTDRTLALLQLLYVAGALFDINWFFFGLEKFKLTVTRNVIIKFLTVAGTLLLVKNAGDIYVYTIVMGGGNFLSQIVLWQFLRKEICPVKISFKGIIGHFVPNLILFIPVIAVSLFPSGCTNNRMSTKSFLACRSTIFFNFSSFAVFLILVLRSLLTPASEYIAIPKLWFEI